jgi:cathepsin A (carboxypeptidase C)
MKVLIVCALILAVAFAKPAEDRVLEVPGMGKFDEFEFYSGYLDIPHQNRSLHYVFAESQNDPENDPLVIWFNGGPGCSSMLGFAQEHGPYVMPDGEEKFYKNENSWNLEANMLYIESPAGVGYSYFWGTDKDSFNDDTSAEDNFAALKQFYEKFPEYKKNDLFISGESYAGIYVPYLAYQIITHNADWINLKGIIVGNGVTNYTYDCEPAYVGMGFWHTLYGTDLHDKLKEYDCDMANLEEKPECAKLRRQFYDLVSKVNVYDVYRHCYYEDEQNRVGSAMINGELKTYKRGMTAMEYTPFLFKNKEAMNSVPPCVYGSGPTDFFNKQEVRDAFNVKTDQVWELCTDRIDYESGEKASYWIYPILKEANIRVLHFSGNADGAVPIQGTRDWIDSLGWPKAKEYAPFYIDNKQVGGFVESYEGITMASIQGIGHMAAQWSPVATRYAVMQFIKDQPIENYEEHFGQKETLATE